MCDVFKSSPYSLESDALRINFSMIIVNMISTSIATLFPKKNYQHNYVIQITCNYLYSVYVPGMACIGHIPRLRSNRGLYLTRAVDQ